MDNQIPASGKIEQPEVNEDYPFEDKKIYTSSQRYPSPEGQSQMAKKMVFLDKDCELVKHELPDTLRDDETHRFSKIVDIESYCGIQDVAGHNNRESGMLEDATPVHRQEMSLTGTENGYTAQQYEQCSHMSESMSSVTEISSTHEKCQLNNEETPVKHTQISATYLDETVDFTSCNPERMQAEDTPHMSKTCDVSTNEDTFLHRQITDTEDKRYKCDICAASFPKVGGLMIHVRTHTGEKPFKCDICAASFTQAGHLKSHMRTHTGERPYKCDICDVYFTHTSRLKCHMRTHTGEKPYVCKVCGATFARADNLKCHMRTHTGEKPYKCDICATSFAQAGYLKIHKRTHTGEKPYKCDICAASFTNTGHLITHARTHTGEKPYKCDVCATSFKKAGYLKIHARTHTGEKPYKCDVCGVLFSHNNRLKFHMRTHTEERLYMCDVCGASFTQAGHLKCHMRTHTGEKSDATNPLSTATKI